MTELLNSISITQLSSEKLASRIENIPVCLHERFEQQVERTPNAIALTWGSKSLSYAQLNWQANQLAHLLRERGVTRDQLVGLHTERGIEMVLGILGILKAGGAYLPLDPIYPKERIAFMIEDSGVRIVVTQDSLKSNLDGSVGAPVLLNETLSMPESNPSPLATIENLAYVIYTSGSTGKPKGVLITHYNVTRLFEATEAWYHFNERDVWTLFHSYAFDFSVWELWGALLYGGRAIVVPHRISRSPEDLRELLVREGVTVLNQTPSAFRQLIQADLSQSKADLALRYVIFGGEALELQSLRPWFERYGDEQPLLVNMYGITETTVHVTYRPLRLADLNSGQGSVIGVPISDLTLHILDSNGKPTTIGTSGEMYVGGAGVARGYLNRAELTEQRFIADPFSPLPTARLYRTGDLARRLENGDIEYLGRIDHQVKIRGFRIELGEIEASIAAHPSIREVIVIAREDNSGDKRLVAYIVATEPAIDLVNQLRVHIRATLPEYMVPAYFVGMDALPLTENGKVDRNALPAPDRTLSETSYAAPNTPTEETLTAIWAEVLGLDRVGIHDNFFELGGHSLLVISVIQRMRQAGLHVTASSFFLAPTVAELATAVGTSGNEVNAPPNLIPPDSTVITTDMLTLVHLSTEELDQVIATVPGGAGNIQDIYPLAPLQEGMLFHHRMATKGDPYLVITVFGSNSREQVDRYLEALQLVIDRHDILRTAFLWEGLSEPVQVVCRQAPLQVEELNLDPANGDIAEQLQQLYDPRRYRLDLRHAPIIRIFIAYDAANKRWVMLRIHHHLLEDHTTDELISEEIHLCLQGQTDRLPVPLPFRNFVAQSRLGTPIEEHQAFFRNMLADVDEPTTPFGFTDVLGDASEISEARSLIDSQLATQLRETAYKYRVSAASLFHLAWAMVLSRCSGRDDIVFGTVLFGRMHAGHNAEQVMGPFINSLPLRLQLDDTSVEDGIRQTHTRMAKLLNHEHASLAVAQSCSAVGTSTPLFNALLNFRHLKIRGTTPENANHAMAIAVSRMGLELLKFEERTNYPLELSVDDLGDGFMLEAQSQSPVAPQRICSYMRTALEQLVVALDTSPKTPLHTLNVLPDTERQQIMVEWNDTARDYGGKLRLHHLIEKQVRVTPESVAVEYENQSLTFAELNKRANQLARLLRQKGVGPDVLVGVFAERSIEMVVSLVAILKAGGAYVPLDPSLPAERLQHMLGDAKTLVVIAQPHLASQIPGGANDVLWIDASWATFANESSGNLDDIGSPENLAYVIFTSGSTGRPKGAMNEHRGICNRLLWMQEQYGLTGDDCIIQKTPFSFDVSVWEFFWPLIAGSRLVIARPEGHRDSAYLVETICQRRITTLHFVPSMLRVFLEESGLNQCDSLKRVICSGEALPHELQERFFAQLPDVELHNLYGPTEAAVDVTYWTCQKGDTRLTVPIGRPVANTQMYVLDARMEPVPLGVTGELYIGGTQVGRGYVGRDDLTAGRFVPDPFLPNPGGRLYKTGDLARHLPDGAIEYLGRTDFQVKIRGQRIELGEIEATLDRHACVGQSVVIAREDSPGDQRLVAYVVLRGDNTPSSDLKAYLSEKLPSYMVPSAFVALDDFPLTSSGKIDRKKLPAPEQSHIQRATFVAPRTKTEELLAEIWASILKLEQVGIHDNFFELGGHSLLAVSVIERMRRASLQTDVRTIFLQPTIAELATAVAADYETLEVPPNRIPMGCKAITPDMLTLLQLNTEEIDRITATVPGGAANIQDIYPLATLQEGFLFHHLLTSEGDLYIMETQFAFDSRERLDRYLDAMQWVVDRHDIQRTAFLWEGLHDPVQVVHRHVPLIVEELDLDTTDGDIAQQLSSRFNLFNYRIDLSVPPMIRIFIAHDPSNDRWIYHQLTHHLMDDQASVNMQEEELHAYLQGKVNQLLPPRPFRNYVAQAKLGVPIKEHEAFFRNMLADVEEPTAPFGYADVLGNGSRIDEARSFVDSGLAQRLLEVGQATGVSTASLFHLAWAKVLALCSGQEDVVFGTVLLGRMNGGESAGQMLGPCINTLPMRISIGNFSVKDSVRQTHTLLAKILRHEHAPLGLVQRSSAVGVNVPVFTSILNYRRPTRGVGRSRHASGTDETSTRINLTADDLTGNGWFSEEIEGREFIRFLERTNYPITLSVDDFGEGFRLVAQVQSPIDPQRICDYMHTALEQLVSALEASPHVSMQTLTILPDEERRQLLAMSNGTQAPYSRESRMQDLFEMQVERTPDRTALKFGITALTYTDLEARANQVAQALRFRGVGRGHRVGLCIDRNADMLAAVLGILKAGAAYVPLDPMFPAERLRFMAEDAQLALLLSTSTLASTFDIPRECQLLLDDDADHINAASTTRLTADVHSAQAEDPAYVIYTSGSTGKPKGVVVPHRAVVNFLTSMAREPGLTADDVLVAVTTLSFDIAVLELQLPLSVGATVVIASREESTDGQALDILLQRSCATVMQATPVTWRLLLEAGWSGKKNFKALVGGEALPKDLADQLIAHGLELWNMYGPTETTVWSACGRITETSNGITIGKPIANTAVYILDSQQNLCPTGVPGELCIGGDGVTLGYWNRPEMTADRFIPDPFGTGLATRLYRTGDLARWRNDGTLEHLGRMDFQVKIRGYRIELGEIETCIAQHSAVREIVVTAREDVPGEKRLVAYLVTHQPHANLQEELRALIRTTMPDYMVPTHFITLDVLPRTLNGKLDRKALPIPDVSNLAQRRTLTLPSTETEKQIAATWGKLLGVSAVGVTDDFFELGGNSLIAVRFFARVKKDFGVSLPLSTLFQAPTIRALAEAIRNQGYVETSAMASATPSSSPAGSENADNLLSLSDLPQSAASGRSMPPLLIRPGKGKLPLFFVHDGLGEVLLYRNLAMRLDPGHPVYGLEPEVSNGRYLHTRIVDMARAKVERIRELQPTGPYMIAGLCAGGVIAFEIARQLEDAGEQTLFVGIIDAADVAAEERKFRIARERIERILGIFRPQADNESILSHCISTLSTLTKKSVSFAKYALSTHLDRARNTKKVAELRSAKQIPPDTATRIDLIKLLEIAQREHSPQGIFCSGDVVLFRASQNMGIAGDQTAREIFTDPLLGWQPRVRTPVIAIDILGGHSTALQEPYVDALAREMQNNINLALQKHGSAMNARTPAAVAG